MRKLKIRNVRRASFGDIIRHVLFAWLLAAAVEYLILPRQLQCLDILDGLAAIPFARMAGMICIAVSFLAGLSLFLDIRIVERWGIVAVFALFASAALAASFSWAFLMACVLLLALLILFAVRGWNGMGVIGCAPVKEHKAYAWITAVMALLFFLFVSAWTVGRVYSFCTPTFDFGIFSQMFYSMKTTGLPLTTVERDGILSHFAVHVSPIYYLLLPFYWLVPIPATLQVLQAAVVTSAVIPLWKLGKLHGLSGVQRMLICAALLLLPAYSGGTSYDIHENCFLTPLILWLVYGIERKNAALTMIFGMLTLTVKEDAAVYVAVIALWVIVKALLRFQKGDGKTLAAGALLLILSLGWFLFVTDHLTNRGDGVMTGRYSNFMYDGSSSLMTVIKAVLMNPMKALYECVDAEKLKFIALSLLPLLGIPLLTRRYERYILLIPYVLVNLMSDYRYQHDIFFQYTFGSNALLLYLTVVNLADIKAGWMRITVSAVAVAVCMLCFAITVVPKAIPYPVQAIRYHSYYQTSRDALDTIPQDASVAATTFYTTHLSQRKMLYDVRYSARSHLLEAEYVVLSVTAVDDYKKYAALGGGDGFAGIVTLLRQNGYEQYASVDGVLVIYRAANNSGAP